MQFIVWAVMVFILDRITKYAVEQLLMEGQSVPVISGAFHITFFKNPGAAFGLFANQTLFFILITAVVMLVIIFLYRQFPKHKLMARISLAVMFGGSAGNLVDRLTSGSVVDFIDFRIWPVFNIADSAIVIGIILLGWEMLRSREEDWGSSS